MDKIGSWIPQVFYDLIGRIVPGGLLLIIALVIFLGPSGVQDLFKSTTITTSVNATTTETTTEISASVLVLFALVVSYMLGALLGGIAAVADRDFWRQRKLDLTGKKENDIAYIYDYIQFHRPDIGARLAKLSAERHMCRVILVGAAILIISDAIAAPVAYSDARFWIIETGLIVMAGAALCLHRHLASRSSELMRNNWRLIQQEQSKTPGK
jgi:hypothetical protein